jgi:competence protein ComEC
MKITPLHFGIFSFVMGVFFSDLFREYWVLNFVFLYFFLFFFQKKIQKYFQILVFGILFFLLGCVRLFFALPTEDLIIPTLYQKPVQITGVIDEFPRQKNDKIQFQLLISSLATGEEVEVQNEKTQKVKTVTEYKNPQNFSQENPEKIMVTVYGQHPEFEYGNVVQITGKIKKPEKFDKFAYDRFLEKEGIYGFIITSDGTVLEKTPENLTKWQQWWQKMFAFRNGFEAETRQKLPFPESEYALGIVLGAEAGIPENILEEFNETGLRHLLALSGFNITILFLIIFWMFSFLPKKIQIFLAFITIFCFVLLTGASSSVVRAAIMGAIGILVLQSGRESSVPFLLLLTVFLMSVYNPFVLVSDMSLQFSVLAVLGLYFLVPVFQKTSEKFFSQKKPKKHAKKTFRTLLQEVLFATLAAQIFTLPLALVFFEQFSLIAPLANIIVAPITSAAMLFSFLTAIPFVGWIFVPFSYALLHFSLGVAHVFSLLPFAVLETSGLPIWSVFPMFLVIFFLVFLVRKK